MKTQNELNAARKSLSQLRATVETEQQQKIEAAFSSMLSTLLQQQAEALYSKASFEAKERDLLHRERMISQFEIYLTEGQKQVKYQLEEQGIRTMDTVDRALIKREAELVAQKQIADVEGKLAIQAERLRLREVAQTMREQQYKALVRDSIESEVLQTAVSREKAAVLGREEYARGFDAGKEEGKKEVVEEVQQGAFIRGYASCRRVQTALHDLRAGRIARDSEELDFLFDAGHVENLFNRGVQIGRLEGGDAAAAAVVNGSELKGLQMVTKGGVEEEGKMEDQMVRKYVVFLHGLSFKQPTNSPLPFIADLLLVRLHHLPPTQLSPLNSAPPRRRSTTATLSSQIMALSLLPLRFLLSVRIRLRLR